MLWVQLKFKCRTNYIFRIFSAKVCKLRNHSSRGIEYFDENMKIVTIILSFFIIYYLYYCDIVVVYIYFESRLNDAYARDLIQKIDHPRGSIFGE